MLLIIAALKDEVKPILNEFEVAETINYRPAVIVRGFYMGKDILVAHTGVGAAKMERAAAFCIKEYRPSACINIGYCGALIPELSLSDIVIADSIVYEATEATIQSTYNLDRFFNKENCEHKFMKGQVLTVDKVVSTPHEKAFLGTKYSAIAVDMESFGLARAATESSTPFAIVRSVCDPMDMHLPDVSNFVSADGIVDPAGLVFQLIKKPHDIAKLPQLKFCAGKAREAFTRLINDIIRD